MIIKEISTQNKDEHGNPLYLIRNEKDYTPQEWKQILTYLKRNAEHKLLKYEILEA